jgi:GNAT superfamily N-acetyltransferase
MRYAIRPLDASTRAAFAELAERNNGVYGGCWCMAYHPEVSRTDAAHNRAGKQRRIREGRAHAALIIDEDGSAQGWCQYGSPAELPGIKHQREYDKDPPPLPDWRITCLLVDKKHRGQGIARAARLRIHDVGGGLPGDRCLAWAPGFTLRGQRSSGLPRAACSPAHPPSWLHRQSAAGA